MRDGRGELQAGIGPGLKIQRSGTGDALKLAARVRRPQRCVVEDQFAGNPSTSASDPGVISHVAEEALRGQR